MTSLLVAYMLSGHDNDSCMLGAQTRSASTEEERRFFDWRFVRDGKQHPATCIKCGRKTDQHFVDPNFRLRNTKMDIGSTLDGYTIVSERFRSFCADIAISGVEFRALPSCPKHYWLILREVLEVDVPRSLGVRFLYYCECCGKYAGVFGTARLRFKGIESPIARGIYRTDLEFGQAHDQSPVIVVGTELAAAIKSQRFRGVCLNAIEYQ